MSKNEERKLAAALFAAFFSAQAAFIVLAPTLPDVARDFGVSIGTAGQLRTAAALAGVATALGMAVAGRRVAIREMLAAGLVLLVAGAGLSAWAPSFLVLALAQLPTGAGVAIVLSAGVAAATEWPPREARMRVLSWAMVGQPAAWVAGVPVVGALAEVDWRLCFAVVPVAAVPATFAVLARPRSSRLAPAVEGPWGEPAVRRWAAGELLAYAGWGGILVYSGALLAGSYGLGADAVGLILGATATAYFPGTFLARTRLEGGNLRELLAGLAAGLAILSLVLGFVRPAWWVTASIFAALVLLAGARGIAGSAFGMHAAPEHKVAIGSMRAAATQVGFLIGAAGGGIAIDLGGYSALGVFLATLFALATLPHLSLARIRGRMALGRPAAAVPCP